MSNNSSAYKSRVAYSAGSRDHSFNNDRGYISNTTQTFAVDPTMDTAQRLYMTINQTSLSEPSQIRRYNADGTADNSFLPLNLPSLNNEVPPAKLDTQGLIFSKNAAGTDTITCIGVAKVAKVDGWYFYPAAIRITTAFVVDESFGNQGGKIYEIPKGADGEVTLPVGQLSSAFTSFRGTKQNNGEIIFSCGLLNMSTRKYAFVLVRIGQDGQPVSGYGTNGVLVITTATETDAPTWKDYGIDASGNITLVGSTPTSGEGILIRYNVDGKPDESYGAGGIKTIKVEGLSTSISAVSVSNDGKTTLLVFASKSNVGEVAVLKLLKSGEPDPAFNGGDPFWISGIPSQLTCLAVDDKYRIIVSGQNVQTGMARVFRVLPDGTLDPDFDGDGAPGNGTVEPPQLKTFNSMVIQNGADIIASSHDFATGTGGGAHVVRLWGEPGVSKKGVDPKIGTDWRLDVSLSISFTRL